MTIFSSSSITTRRTAMRTACHMSASANAVGPCRPTDPHLQTMYLVRAFPVSRIRRLFTLETPIRRWPSAADQPRPGTDA